MVRGATTGTGPIWYLLVDPGLVVIPILKFFGRQGPMYCMVSTNAACLVAISIAKDLSTAFWKVSFFFVLRRGRAAHLLGEGRTQNGRGALRQESLRIRSSVLDIEVQLQNRR